MTARTFKIGWRIVGALLAVALIAVDSTDEVGAAAQSASFDTWLTQVRWEAVNRGLAAGAADAALAQARYLDRVVELDRRQPELTQTFWRYLDARVTTDRVAQGQALMVTHQRLLDRVFERYGVQPRVLVALWGLESDYGRSQGDFEVVSAVATLAYDGRRSDFFREQLFAVLGLIEQHDVPGSVRGSWAGAMGQPQFMPTTWRQHAVDFDGDGYRDLRASLPDVFASAAAYLSASGWSSRSSWGHEVILPPGFDFAESGLESEKPLVDWRSLGVRLTDGGELPDAPLVGSVLLPGGARGPAFLVYRNFRAILRWNNSVLYALTVGHLSDRLAGAGPLAATRPVEEVPLTRYDVVELQSRLASLGFEPGEADGIIGEKTRRAIRMFQKSVALPADGYPDPDLLQHLRSQALP